MRGGTAKLRLSHRDYATFRPNRRPHRSEYAHADYRGRLSDFIEPMQVSSSALETPGSQ